MPRLGYLMLYVRDVAAVKNWYEAHFGMRLYEGDGEKFASLALAAGEDETLLALHQGEPAAEPHKTSLYFRVESVDETFRRMTDGGAQFHVPPENTPWGKRQAATHDPAGHTVGIYSK